MVKRFVSKKRFRVKDRGKEFFSYPRKGTRRVKIGDDFVNGRSKPIYVYVKKRKRRK